MKKKDIRKKMVVVMTGTCPLGKFLLTIFLWRRQFVVFPDLVSFMERFEKFRSGDKEYAVIQYAESRSLNQIRAMLSPTFEFFQVSVNAYESLPEDLPIEQAGSDAAFCSHGSTAEVYDRFEQFFVWGPKDMERSDPGVVNDQKYESDIWTFSK